MSGKRREMSESGMLVYPKLPMPKRESEPRMPKGSGGSGGVGKIVLVLVLGLAGGAAAGFVLRPMLLTDTRVVEAEQALAKEKLATADALKQVAAAQDETKKIDEQREQVTKELDAAKQAQAAAADKQADASKTKVDLDAAKKKLEATGAGSVTVEGGELRLAIADGKLFKGGDDLSPAGAKVLDKIAGVLKEIPGQVAVHGHTDDTPPPKPAQPKKKDKSSGEKKDKSPPPPAAEPEFATNWELSSARALAVVHYFQDTHKIDATRLSISAFSQYRPASRSNKAANRRIELVLTPKPKK